MPDITLCLNDKCPKAKKCYRFMAKPSNRQSVCNFKYDDGCEHFEPIDRS
ncbi:unnamed protein product [marine sediment metagenome]|uniref:Uncharacterized protein n=1 Tax=marine sediment metagenome TaxID=412755 RepID=X0UW21_9ZZZZ